MLGVCFRSVLEWSNTIPRELLEGLFIRIISSQWNIGSTTIERNLSDNPSRVGNNNRSARLLFIRWRYSLALHCKEEYPTAINTCNISNETLVGKVFLENPDEIDVQLCEGFVFRGDDKEKYKMDKHNYLLEIYTEGDVFNFANIFLNLPTPSEILEGIKEI